MDWKQMLMQIMTKKAKGYSVKEKTEEFALSDGELVLTKKKIVTKHIAADLNAAKALLELTEMTQNDVFDMTDQQLEVERLRLIKMLDVCDKYNQQNDTTQQNSQEKSQENEN